MAEGNTSGGQSKSRSVLGDLTNRCDKRGFSGREKNGVKCFDFKDKNDVKRICVSPRPCSEINSLKGNVISGLSKVPNENRDPVLSGFGSGNAASKSSSYVNDDHDGGLCVKGQNVVIGNSKFNNLDNVFSHCVDKLDIVNNNLGDSYVQVECSKDDLNLVDKEGEKHFKLIENQADACGQVEFDSSKENKVLGIASELVNEKNCTILEHSVSKNVADLTVIGGGGFVQGSSETQNKENDPISVNTEADDDLCDSFSADTSKTMSETGNDFLHDGKNFDGGELNTSLGGIHSNINSHHNDLEDHDADNFILSQSGSVDCTILPQSQESRVFGIDKSAKLREDECDHMTMGNNSMRACSCSFCTKAAYIWLDLHHKDIKARMSGLKKSQKDASILAEKSCRNKANEKHGPESSTKASKLESHLMHQWRSLFKYMSNVWEEEGNQLEASRSQLNNLKGKCKAELESSNAKQSEEH